MRCGSLGGIGEGLCPARGRPRGPPLRRFGRAGPVCPAGVQCVTGRADRGVRPYGFVTSSAVVRDDVGIVPYGGITRGAVGRATAKVARAPPLAPFIFPLQKASPTHSVQGWLRFILLYFTSALLALSSAGVSVSFSAAGGASVGVSCWKAAAPDRASARPAS